MSGPSSSAAGRCIRNSSEEKRTESSSNISQCPIARAINPSVFGVLFNNWALVLAILSTTLAIRGLTGWLLVRYSALPGATGAWGSSPGGASAMVVMAQ
ncbi:AbrB family transcriptional regulator, partial [Klebsiella pneumoniae]